VNLNIRNGRDYSKIFTFKALWLREQYTRLRKIYDPSEISNEELRIFLLNKYEQRRLVEGRLYSNTNQKNEIINQEQFIDLFLNRPYILSGYATFYENQSDGINIGSAALKFLLDSRKKYKKMQEESEYGSDAYIYYKILQLTFKVLANSYYGILGEKNSVFYNPHVQNSITMSGQDLTTTAIATLENFLADNQQFNDFDDIMRFITETLSEEQNDTILRYVDEPKTVLEVMDYLVSKTINFSPEMEEVLEKALRKLTVEELTRLFYKNKVLDFVLQNTYPRNQLSQLIKYEFSEKPEEAMVGILNEFKKAVIDFCFSNILFEDRYKRVIKNERKFVVGSDTDSVFINFNKYVTEVTDEFKLDPENETQQMTVINIFISIVTDILESTFTKMTNNMGLLEEYAPIINMKSEFLFKKMLLTRNKKSYASIITAELGKILRKPVLDVKGLSIKKTTISKRLRKRFMDILENSILKSKQIDLKSIIKQFDDLGIEIEDSLKKGEILYLLPKNLESIDGYKDPATLEPVRGALIWNALEPENQIVPPEKINLLKLTVYDKNDPRLQTLRNNHPEKYNALMRVVFNEGVKNPTIDISRFGLSTIAIPKSVEHIPDYLRPFIDYKTMVNKNMTNGYILLESLGVYTEEVKTNKYKSNIIEI
jgi:hypothetical protein